MKEELKLLLELQDLDLELERAVSRKAEIPREIEKLEEELKKKEEETRNFEESLKKKKLECNKLDHQLKEEEEKLIKKKGDLLNIKTNEEYRAILHEIELTEKKISELEDMAINALLELERMESELPSVRKEFENFREETKKRIEELKEESKKVEEKIEELREEIELKKRHIPGKLLLRYNRIKEKRGLPAIVSIVNGACGGCHAELPINLVIELQTTGDIGVCENCGRLLIYKKDES